MAASGAAREETAGLGRRGSWGSLSPLRVLQLCRRNGRAGGVVGPRSALELKMLMGWGPRQSLLLVLRGSFTRSTAPYPENGIRATFSVYKNILKQKRGKRVYNCTLLTVISRSFQESVCKHTAQQSHVVLHVLAWAQTAWVR